MKHLFLLLVLICFVGCTSNKKEDVQDTSNETDTVSENFDEYDESESEFPEDPLDEDANEDISAADGDTYDSDEADDSMDETSEYGSDDTQEGESGDDFGYQDSEETEETESQDSQDYSYSEESEDSFAQTDDTQSYSDDTTEVEPKGYVPVKKIKFETFEKAARLINAVYIVREGDTLASISGKIYGDPQRESELLEINTTLARKISVGDKVYYNSPNRPNDRGRLVPYYEDANINSNVYSAKKGENIRDIAENLLGNRESWKELWAKNPDLNESEKWTLTQDREITYWPVGQAPSAPIEVAENTQEPPPDVMNEPPPPDMTDMPPSDDMGMPPPPPTEMADMPPPPGMDDMGMPPPPPPPGMDDMGAPPPPPPPPPLPDMADVPPPPPAEVPPPPTEMADMDSEEGGIAGLLEKLPGGGDKVTVLAAGVVLIMVVLLLAVRRKSKSRKKSLEATGFGETQI